MQKYTVESEAGLITSDEQAHAHKDVVELDKTDAQTQEWVAAGVLVAVPEEAAPAADATPADATPEAPVLAPLGHYSLEVTWKDGVTQEDQDAALPFIQEFTKALAESPEDHMPLTIVALTVKRDPQQ